MRDGRVRRDAWKDWTTDPRGCGGCTVRQYERTQSRVFAEIIARLVADARHV
jgi:hypothetical protein